MAVSSVWQHWTNQDVAIDLGTANTLVFVLGRGIVVDEPSLLVMEEGKGEEPFAVGREAREMLGRTPRELRVVHPMQRGVIADYSATQKMLKCFLERALPRRRPWGARVVVSVPAMATPVEARAFRDVVSGLPGIRSVSMVPDPLAGAHGAGLPIGRPTGCMLVDIGAGTTGASVLSNGGIVISRAIPLAGDAMDERIIQYLRSKYNLVIGERTAEELKIHVGSAKPLSKELSRLITGYDLANGLPGTIQVRTNEVHEAISGILTVILDLVCRVLELTPPELSADILDRGVVLTGGASLLRNMDELVAERLGLPVTVANEPRRSVACGAAEMMGTTEAEHELGLRVPRPAEIQ